MGTGPQSDITCLKNGAEVWNMAKSFNFDFKIRYLLFDYSALNIRIIRIVFGIQKMNEYEYRIALFGPNYSNIRIIRIIRPNTVLRHYLLRYLLKHQSKICTPSFS